MSIDLEPALEARLRARADAEGLTISEYVERLVHDEDAEVAHTEALLREAAESGDYIELTPDEWDRIEREALAEAQSRSKRRE